MGRVSCEAPSRSARVAQWVFLVVTLAAPVLPALAAEAPAKPQSRAPAKKKAPPKPTTSQLLKMIEEQRALIDEQQRLIAEQQARIAEQEAKLQEQGAAIAAQKAQLAEMEARLAAMNGSWRRSRASFPRRRISRLSTERLKRVEEAAQKAPELPPTVVSAGDFPGSIRIPGTDAAIKFGGRIRTAAVFTLGPLGSEDRFLTNSIPVEPDDEAAGKGQRTTFSANTSRFNFEMRTPTGAGHMRAFIEGDFFGSSETEKRTDFRLRHAFAQFQRLPRGPDLVHVLGPGGRPPGPGLRGDQRRERDPPAAVPLHVAGARRPERGGRRGNARGLPDRRGGREPRARPRRPRGLEVQGHRPRTGRRRPPPDPRRVGPRSRRRAGGLRAGARA